MHAPLPETEEGLVYADIDLGMISLAKAAADPAGHYARPDVTRLILDKTPGDRVVTKHRAGTEVTRGSADAPAIAEARAETFSSPGTARRRRPDGVGDEEGTGIAETAPA